MRLLRQSQTFFIASVLLHIGLFSVLLSNTFNFSHRVDSFEATVRFETPEPPRLKQTAVKATKTATKPAKTIPVAPPTTNLKANLGPENNSALPFSSKKIDDILKKRKSKIEKSEPSEEKIVKKKSDLLGYLKATKRTKEEQKENNVQKEKTKEPVKKTTLENTSDKKDNKSTSSIQPETIKSRKTQESTGDKNLFPNAKTVKGSDTPETTVDSDKKTAALKIWQKKNDTQAYRKVLRQLVTANWKVPPVSIKTFQILIEATIDPNGNLLKTKIVESSGLAILDAAAERAIRVSTPFPRLPKSMENHIKQYQAMFRFTPDEVLY